MKKLVYILLFSVIFPFCGFTQVVDNIDYISPFHDGLAAIQKGSDWAFIDEMGTKILDYRDDLVPLNMKDGRYPVFKNGRALIKATKEGIIYYGFIDIKGQTVIEPQFINAVNFKFDKAIVMNLIKTKLGHNKVMDKPVVSYEYQEVVIDNLGRIQSFLTEPKVMSDLKPLSKIPSIQSKIISNTLVITKQKDLKITLTKI